METTIIISPILRLRQPIRIFLLEKNHRYKIPNAIINPERKFMNTSSSNQFPRSSFELARIESFSSLEEITLLLLLLLLLLEENEPPPILPEITIHPRLRNSAEVEGGGEEKKRG